MAFKLYYWDGLQGRGEFVRLVLEDVGAAYEDIARSEADDAGAMAVMRLLDSDAAHVPPFAPPVLQDGDLVISHVANILLHLGPKLGLAPNDEGLRITAHGLQLTIADAVAEIHDTHHPIASGTYYEDQKGAAAARAADFLSNRMPKFLRYFERVLQRAPDRAGYVFGVAVSTVDLSLFQLFAGLRYAFPRATADFPARYPALANLHGMVAHRPNIAAYLASSRRIPFNEDGIFRCYPELDQDA